MSETKAPGWLRAFDVVFGLIAVILSVVVLAYQELAILTMILVLSVVLLVTGIARIFNGVFARYLSDGIRAANIALGIVALVYADLTTQLLIYILSFALLLNGVARLVIGEFGKAFPKWLRAFFAVVGVLTIILAALVFVYSDLGFLALVLLLSFTFMFNGIARIIQGVTGIQETEEF
jgi:uncharacterized membrane protein HdeD (DUF308 family)